MPAGDPTLDAMLANRRGRNALGAGGGGALASSASMHALCDDDDEAPSAPDVKRRRGRSPEVIDLDSISPMKADDASSLIGSFAYSGAYTAGPSSSAAAAAAAAAPEPIEWLTKRRNQSEAERAATIRTAKLTLSKTRGRAGGGGGGGGGGTRSAGKRTGGRGGSSGRGGAAARKRRRSVLDSEEEDEEEEEAEESDESWNSEAEAAAEAAEAAEIEDDEIEDDEIEVREIEVPGARKASRAVPNTAAAGAAAAGWGGRRLIKTADVKGRAATGRAQAAPKAAPSGANLISDGLRKESAIAIDSDEEDEDEDEEEADDDEEEDEGMDDGDGEEEVGFEDGERGRPPETEAEARAVVSRSLSACEAESRQISSALAAIAPAAAASTTAEDEVGAQDGALHLTKGGDGQPLRVQPASLGGSARMVLKEYQLVGLNWLWLMWRVRAGGILADEMGLGKTIQVIALICAIKEAQSAQSGFGGGHADGADDSARHCHLVVAPASTLDNWLREFGLWAPSLVVAKYHGSQALRSQMQRDLDDSTFDVLVLPYTYFEGEGAASQYDRRWLRRRRWGLGVFDEAHALKTSGSARYKRLSQLTIAHRLLLSGTPVQNNLHELLTLLSFMLPRAFPPRLADAFAVLDKARRDRSSAGARGGARGGGGGGGGCGGGGGRQAARDPDAVAIAKARRLLAPFVLRRRKSEVVTHLLTSLMTSDRL